MATMEKPKQKKKKKIRPQIEEDEKTEDFGINLEFPTTSTRCDEILSHDCFVSSEFQQLSLKEEISVIEYLSDAKEELDVAKPAETKESSDKDGQTTGALLTEAYQPRAMEPSAPELSLPPITSVETRQYLRSNCMAVAYPDISAMQRELESSANPMEKNYKSNVKPFTYYQIKELYTCTELEMVRQFETEFLTNSASGGDYSQHQLHQLLVQYSNLRSKLKVNQMDLQNLKKRLRQSEAVLWQDTSVSVSYAGTCSDEISVSGIETYDVVILNESALKTTGSCLSQIHELVCFSYTTNLVFTESTKQKIEQAVREILCYPVFNKIGTDSPVILNRSHDVGTLSCISHLRIAITILFNFVRKPAPDKIFLTDVKTWLEKLVALQLRVATWEDHMFLLFNILRCPSGIASWATSLIQIPRSFIDIGNFTDFEFNHMVTFLSVLLMPIKKRNDFLVTRTQTHKEISDPVKEDLWILVDSDGEEGSTSTGESFGLKESDLISFLNQIPFETLFSSMLSIEKRGENFCIPEHGPTGQQLLKIIAFSTTLIELLGEGLATYNTERYKQFAKRLGRLIRHTIQYISDYLELYMKNGSTKDPYLYERIHVEFDAFVLKACGHIYRARNLGTWQYFSSLPFSVLNTSTLWTLFYYLNVGFPTEITTIDEDVTTKISDPTFWHSFNDATAETLPDDHYYLLQAIQTMALERDRNENWDFIKHICSHIFSVGYTNSATHEICYKTSRDMLANLTATYPELISEILFFVQYRIITDGENFIYLFKALPLNKWRPTIENFETLSKFLNYHYDTHQNVMARFILGHLNWNWDSDYELFLPHEIHLRVACLICEALNKHAPETVGSSGISESVRQVSTLMESQTSKEQFVWWCWNMASVLRLHLMDQNKTTIQKVLQCPAEILGRVPELERIDIIFQGVTESRPLAIFLSILLSLWGHSIPLICQIGFGKLQLLINDYRHASVIRCLNLITPIFLECPETLSKCESFQNIIKQILNSDRTYMKMAKDLISSNSPGPVLELFANMIQAQIINYTELGLSTPTLIVNLWLQCLTHLPNWQCASTFYLIDLIVKIAYQFPDAWWSCREYLRFVYKNTDETKLVKPSALKMLWGSSNACEIFPAPSCDAAWFSLINLELEHEIQEQQTRVWPELLRQLKSTSGKINVETVLKRTLVVTGCQIPLSAYNLVVYKYATLISSMEVNHPLLPIICQKYFHLFLDRVPFNEDEERFHESFGVADKFYEYNISLMKKLKSRLKQAEDFYTELSNKNTEGEQEPLIYFYRNCSKIFKTYLLWLEETTINKISRNQNIDLPPQYNVEKLQVILLGAEQQYWTEYLYLPAIRKQQKDAANSWLKSCCRYVNQKKISVSASMQKISKTPKERIVTHLKSYDRPVNPPEFIREELLMKPVYIHDVNMEKLSSLKGLFDILKENAKQFNLIVKEISALNGNYKDLLRSLYTHIKCWKQLKVKCSTVFSKSAFSCAGPAVINVEIMKSQKDENVQRKINNNRDRHDKLVDHQLTQNVSKLVNAIETIEHNIRYLILFQTEARDKNYDPKNLSDVAIQYFFHTIDNMNENIVSFPSTNHVCTLMLQQLGVFIQEYQEKQGLRVLETALKRPEMVKLLSDLFVPSHTGPESFLNMYKFLIDSHMRRCDAKILFVLFSKFDLQNWLQSVRPKLAEISQLIKLCVIGLEHWNQPESNLIQGLLRRHLVHIFEHNFPEHYGEVLQIALTGSSEQKLMPAVLLDLLNSLLVRCGCDSLDFDSNQSKVSEQIIKFATQQNLFNFKSITDTVALFAKHFQTERLQHGLHGLYPKHKDYCFPLSTLFSCFGHAAVVSAVCLYPGVLADQICEWLFPPIVEMYSPWLVIYSGQNLQKSTANWIRQLIANGKILYPWSELHADTAQIMIYSFISCLQYILQNLPVSSSTLSHALGWYEYHFAKRDIGQHILVPIHNALILLPWSRLEPSPSNIESFYKILHEFLPECHSFLGFIFVQIQWNSWLNQNFYSWNHATQIRTVAPLLKVFIQISFEPHVHENVLARKILEESLHFPWYLVDYQGLENVFNWFVISVEPAIILKMPSERNPVDIAVLELLKHAAGMSSSTRYPPSSQLQMKKILYVRSSMRVLRACGSKHQKLLATKEGSQSFTDALIELISLIESSASATNTTRSDAETEARNMMVEVVGPLQSQSEIISKLSVEAIIIWQSKCDVGSFVLCCTLDALGSCKSFIHGMYSLLEATIFNYFRHSVETENYHNPTWTSVLQKLGRLPECLDLFTLIQGTFLLSLHTFILHKLKSVTDIGDRITFLQDLSQLLETVKTNQMTEPRIAIIWGTIISCGYQILKESDNAKKPLLMLARYLHTLSTQSEGWGEGLLGVIGLKKDSASNRRKILTRCLSCLIFALFPDTSTESKSTPSQEFLVSLNELKTVAGNKKYADVRHLSVKAIEMIETNETNSSKINSVVDKIYDIISLFYNESFLISIRDVWRFE